MMFAVELYFELNFGGPGRLGARRRVFLVGQRNETLDVNSIRRNARAPQRFERAFHERLGTAYVAVCMGPRSRQFCEEGDGWQTLNRIEPVEHFEPRRMLLGERVDLLPIDNRLLVAIGIDEAKPAATRDKRRSDDRKNRRDTAAAGE